MKVEELGLRSERLGPLPIINHFIHELDLDGILDRFVPTTDGRVRLPYSKAVGVAHDSSRLTACSGSGYREPGLAGRTSSSS